MSLQRSPPRLDQYLLWLLASAAAAVAVAWVAFHLQQEGFAPAVLFPLLVGAGLGALLALAARLTNVQARRAAVVLALAWGLLAVAGQDYIAHRVRLRSYEAQISQQHPLAALAADGDRLRPRFWPFWRSRVTSQTAWWTLEAVLTAGAAAAVVCWSGRRGQSQSTSSETTLA